MADMDDISPRSKRRKGGNGNGNGNGNGGNADRPVGSSTRRGLSTVMATEVLPTVP